MDIKHLEFVDGNPFENGLSEWHIQLASRFNNPKITYELYLNTQKPSTEIFSQYRRSLRDRIKQAEKLWDCKYLTSVSTDIDSVWNEFKLLHLTVSGRKTRNDKSWDLQKEIIRQGQGILFYLLNASGQMIGGSFFQYTRDEAWYYVSASDRSLFDKPVGHLMQAEAIKHLCKLNIRWYKLGSLAQQNQSPTPSEKELKISHFKKQFSSNVFAKFIFCHSMPT